MQSKHLVLTLALTVTALGLSPGLAAEAPARPPADPTFAEELYGEFAAATGSQIRFEVETLARGSLRRLAGRSFGELLEAPDYHVETTQFGTEIRHPRFLPGLAAAPALDDLAAEVDGFETVGYPLELGRYRKLQVGVAIGSQIHQHQALELCWPSLAHCAVLDPAVVFLQSVVENRRRLAAEGWGPRVLLVKAESLSGSSAGLTATCGLASNPGVTDKRFSWGAYWVEYRNIFGMTLVHKDMGAQQAGLRCDANCMPAPYGFSNASSCWGTLGWNCACDNDFGFGTGGGGGRSGKWIAETRCTHQWVGSARASATVFDQGTISVDIQWDVDGGEDANGGEILDTCGFF